MHDPAFSHFGTLPACDRQTDGRTGGQVDDSIYRASIASRGKMDHVTLTTPVWGCLSSQRLTINKFYRYTKFNESFRRLADIIAAVDEVVRIQ